MASSLPGRISAGTILAVMLFALSGCADGNGHQDSGPAPGGGAVLEKVMIVGSAETPDPVLARVRELEARGQVRDVVVRESFPVQIELRATREVIDELQAIPRQGGLR